MISTDKLTLAYGARILFENVDVKFAPENCYGLIGANGAGKSTFLKILSGEIEPTSGSVMVPPNARRSVLKQNHFEFNDEQVLRTVILGHKRLFDIMVEKEALYAKGDFDDADGLRLSELESDFVDLNGWDAEASAAQLLSGLGITEDLHTRLMKELTDGEKVRVLLAQALFGDPDILLLDEPTNHLDIKSILWLEEFLINFKNTVIVVSHDRHFLDNVCTHIADIDFQKVQMYTGNYSFWYQASQLALRQKQDQNRKTEDKMAELKDFIARFSANASKSRQATARKKMLSKLSLEEIRPSSRRYPHVVFKSAREAGREILTVKDVAKAVDGETLFQKVTFQVTRGDRIAFVGKDSVAVSTLIRTLVGEEQPDKGDIAWGQTTMRGYFPKDNQPYFDVDLNLIDWLRQYSTEKEENFIRSFLGRMLFSGEETLKSARVLSGGEKVRCMLAKLMMESPNVLILDGPTNHLDLESITAVNEGLLAFKGTLLFSSHDVQFVQSLATRVIEVEPSTFKDLPMTYDEYLEHQKAA